MKEGQAVSAGDILREYAAVTGWDAASLLAVALEYIDHLDTAGLGDGDALRAFLRGRAAEEVEMTED